MAPDKSNVTLVTLTSFSISRQKAWLRMSEGPDGVSINPLFFKMLIDFRQILYDSVEKVLFKAVFFAWQKY